MTGYHRGRYFVEGRRLDASWGRIDVFDLEEESFKGWLVETLMRLLNPSATAPADGAGLREFKERRPPIQREERTPGGPGKEREA